MYQSSEYADTGFRPNFEDISATSNIGPVILGFFAFFILTQGLIYILKPELTSRSVSTDKKKMRRIGIVISLIAAVMMFAAFSWWTDEMSAVDHVTNRP